MAWISLKPIPYFQFPLGATLFKTSPFSAMEASWSPSWTLTSAKQPGRLSKPLALKSGYTLELPGKI